MSKEKSAMPVLVHTDGEFQHHNIEIRYKSYHGQSSLHWHDYYELEYLQSGSMIYQYNGNEYHLTAGSAYLVTPSDYHRIIADHAVLYNIAFNEAQVSDDLMELLICQSGNTVVTFPIEARAEIERLLGILQKEYESKNHLYEYKMRRLYEAVLVDFVRAIPEKEADKPNYSSAVMQAVSYIRMNFKEKLTLRDVAAAVHLTPNYLGELFKSEMGISFTAYLMQTRLVFARNLLQSEKCTIAEAAIAAGFTSQTYFSECFRKVYGYSPAKARDIVARP